VGYISVFRFIGGRHIMPPVNGWLCTCTERASAKKRLFSSETMERAAQLLLDSPGAAQILRA
jgi:hypothetical protein